MKKLILLLTLLASTVVFAQSEKYTKAMAPLVVAIDTTRDPATLLDLANRFERIAVAEKTQWLPYYYAALATVNSGYMAMTGQPDENKIDPVADKAQTFLDAALALQPASSEIFAVQKMIYTLKMSANPMQRYMQYGPKAGEALAKAKALDANNPRVYYLEGQDKWFTPAQFGGSKADARKLWEKAIQLYDAAKPANPLDPTWGRGAVMYFLSQK